MSIMIALSVWYRMENDLVKVLEQIKTNIGEDVFLNSNRMNGLLSDLLPSAKRD